GFTEQHFWLALRRDIHRIDDIACDHGYDARRIDGPLWGGNLSMLAHLAGTAFFPAIEGGILYVEEISEEPYAIERLLLQLYHAGSLGRQRALILGDFTDCTPKNPARYPYSMDEVVETLRTTLPFPVLTGLPFGHVPRKVTLPFVSPGSAMLRAVRRSRSSLTAASYSPMSARSVRRSSERPNGSSAVPRSHWKRLSTRIAVSIHGPNWRLRGSPVDGSIADMAGGD